MTYTVIDSFGLVRNLIVWDGKSDYPLPQGWTIRPATLSDKIEQ